MLTNVPSTRFHGFIFHSTSLAPSTDSESCPALMWYKNCTCFARSRCKWNDKWVMSGGALMPHCYTSPRLILHLFSVPSICPCMNFPSFPSCFTFIACTTICVSPLSSCDSCSLLSVLSPCCLFSAPQWSVLRSGQVPWQLSLSVGATALIINLTKPALWKKKNTLTSYF